MLIPSPVSALLYDDTSGGTRGRWKSTSREGPSHLSYHQRLLKTKRTAFLESRSVLFLWCSPTPEAPLFRISNPIQQVSYSTGLIEIKGEKKKMRMRTMFWICFFFQRLEPECLHIIWICLSWFYNYFSETPWLFLSFFFFFKNRGTPCLDRLGWETNKGSIILCTAEPINEFRRHLDVFLEEGMGGGVWCKGRKVGLR